MAEHHASVLVDAPVHQVYVLFSHFNDFPKFMHFVKEVTYYDDQRSHWVAQIAGQHEWDAMNEDWIEDQQIGWRSTRGLENNGKVTFRPQGEDVTMLDVYISYKSPLGIIGDVVGSLGIDSQFDEALQQDIEHFARMVDQAPLGALDPMSSHYLFHDQSAVTRGTVTNRQKEAMANDPMMSNESLLERQNVIAQDVASTQAAEREEQARRANEEAQYRQAAEEHRQALEQQAQRDQQAKEEAARERENTPEPDVDEEEARVQATIGGRNAGQVRTPWGDQDSRTERYRAHEQDPMTPRTVPTQDTRRTANPDVRESREESPWKNPLQGEPHEDV